jgi:hypothetical protein
VRVVTSGPGARSALSTPGEGRVLAGFAKACYLSLPDGLVALVGPGVAPGPLHAVLDVPPPRPPVGSRVSLSPAVLEVAGDVIGLGEAAAWEGPLPAPADLLATAAAAAAVLAPIAERSLVPPGRAAAAVERLAAGDLAGAARLLAGSGPGLTPAGDDALGGMLFSLRALAGPEVEASLVAVAERASTTLLASAYLRWAARGQALACVHDLFAATVAADRAGAEAAAQALGSVGHSSGADFAQGLMWGLGPVAAAALAAP